MPDYEYHEASKLFPMLEGTDFDSFKASIKEKGQLVAAKLLDGKILDGRNRYRACKALGIALKTEAVKTDDPVGLVVALNLERRHLNESQRAMIGARAREMIDREAKERQRQHGGTAPGKRAENTSGKFAGSEPPRQSRESRNRAAALVNVGGRTVDHASTVIKKGVPELVKAVESGKVAVSRAAQIAAQPPAVQKETIEKIKAGTPASKAAPSPTPRTNGSGGDGGGTIKLQGVGVIRANEAVSCLRRIPKNDPLRKRGFQIVLDWIKANK